MYERGSEQWNDRSSGSGAPSPANGEPRANGYVNGSVFTANGSANGSASGSAASEEPHVWYRSPSGEIPSVPTSYEQNSYAASTYAPSTYEATTYEAAYAPVATSPLPATPPAPGVADVTVYDPATGMPLAGTPVVYPMRNVAGRMAMILGVCAIVFTSILFPLFPLAFFFAIGAVILGRRGRLRARYGFASNPGSAGGGFALGVVAMVLVVLWSALTAWLCLTYSANDLKNCVQDTHNAPEAIHCVADVVDAA
jgi:hypothetical protein